MTALILQRRITACSAALDHLARVTSERPEVDWQAECQAVAEAAASLVDELTRADSAAVAIPVRHLSALLAALRDAGRAPGPSVHPARLHALTRWLGDER